MQVNMSLEQIITYLDNKYGKDFVKDRPTLLGQCVRASATSYLGDCIFNGLVEIAEKTEHWEEKLKSKEEFKQENAEFWEGYQAEKVKAEKAEKDEKDKFWSEDSKCLACGGPEKGKFCLQCCPGLVEGIDKASCMTSVQSIGEQTEFSCPPEKEKDNVIVNEKQTCANCAKLHEGYLKLIGRIENPLIKCADCGNILESNFCNEGCKEHYEEYKE